MGLHGCLGGWGVRALATGHVLRRLLGSTGLWVGPGVWCVRWLVVCFLPGVGEHGVGLAVWVGVRWRASSERVPPRTPYGTRSAGGRPSPLCGGWLALSFSRAPRPLGFLLPR